MLLRQPCVGVVSCSMILCTSVGILAEAVRCQQPLIRPWLVLAMTCDDDLHNLRQVYEDLSQKPSTC